jgi:hypothetical protein
VNKKLCLRLIIVGLFTPVAVSGRESVGLTELVTDRPDFTESAIVVSPGQFQLESGLTWEKGNNSTNTLSGPESLVRWGLLPRVELRLGLPDYLYSRNHERISGFGDSSIGTKVQLGPIGGGWDMATIISLSLPTGEDPFGSDEFDPELIQTLGRELSGPWSIGSQLMVSWPSEEGDRVFLWGGTIVIGTSVSELWGAFIEVAFTVPETGTTAVLLHNGYTYLYMSGLQFDLHGGIGLSDSAPDLFLGSGISLRY